MNDILEKAGNIPLAVTADYVVRLKFLVSQQLPGSRAADYSLEFQAIFFKRRNLCEQLPEKMFVVDGAAVERFHSGTVHAEPRGVSGRDGHDCRVFSYGKIKLALTEYPYFFSFKSVAGERGFYPSKAERRF